MFRLTKILVLGIFFTTSLTACFETVEEDGVNVAKRQNFPIVSGQNLAWLEERLSDVNWVYSESFDTLTLTGKVKLEPPFDEDKMKLEIQVVFDKANSLLDKAVTSHGYKITTKLKVGDKVSDVSTFVNGDVISGVSVQYSPQVNDEEKANIEGILSKVYTQTFSNLIRQKEIATLWKEKIFSIRQLTYPEKTYGDLCANEKIKCVVNYNPFPDKLSIEPEPANGGEIELLMLQIDDASSILDKIDQKQVSLKETIKLKNTNGDDLYTPYIDTVSIAPFEIDQKVTESLLRNVHGTDYVTVKVDEAKKYLYPLFAKMYLGNHQ